MTWGVGVHYLYPVINIRDRRPDRRAVRGRPIAADDSNVLLDIVALPAGLLPVADNVQLYASVPVGISLDFWGDDVRRSATIGTGFGFTLGVMLGRAVRAERQLRPARRARLTSGTARSTRRRPRPVGVTVENDVEVDTSQFALNFGAYF